MFFEYLDMESLTEPVVIRSRPKAEDGGRSNGDNPEKAPNIEQKGGHAVQAMLVPVKQQDHLGLISTTSAQVISYTTYNFSY